MGRYVKVCRWDAYHMFCISDLFGLVWVVLKSFDQNLINTYCFVTAISFFFVGFECLLRLSVFNYVPFSALWGSRLTFETRAGCLIVPQPWLPGLPFTLGSVSQPTNKQLVLACFMVLFMTRYESSEERALLLLLSKFTKMVSAIASTLMTVVQMKVPRIINILRNILGYPKFTDQNGRRKTQKLLLLILYINCIGTKLQDITFLSFFVLHLFLVRQTEAEMRLVKEVRCWLGVGMVL